jgi:hypothetical protein
MCVAAYYATEDLELMTSGESASQTKRVDMLQRWTYFIQKTRSHPAYAEDQEGKKAEFQYREHGQVLPALFGRTPGP